MVPASQGCVALRPSATIARATLSLQSNGLALSVSPGAPAKVSAGRFADDTPLSLGAVPGGHDAVLNLAASRVPQPWRVGIEIGAPGSGPRCGRLARPQERGECRRQISPPRRSAGAPGLTDKAIPAGLQGEGGAGDRGRGSQDDATLRSRDRAALCNRKGLRRGPQPGGRALRLQKTASGEREVAGSPLSRTHWGREASCGAL